MVLVDARDLQSKRSDIYTSKGGKSLLQPHQESVAGRVSTEESSLLKDNLESFLFLFQIWA